MTHLAKHRLKRLPGKEQQALAEFHQRLKKALGANLVDLKLFGSKASGRSTPASDIDLFVLVRRYSSRLEDRVIDLAFDINLQHDVYISPRVVGAAILKHPVWRLTPFLRSIKREGLSV